MKRVLGWLGISLALILAVYFLWFAAQTVQKYDIGAIMAPRLLFATVVAALLYALVIPLSGRAWAVLLRDTGQTWPASHLAAIMGFTQLAKYVPGNVGQHIGRAALSLSKGMPPGCYLGTVVVETLLSVLGGVLVGVACAMLSPLSSSVPWMGDLVLLAGVAGGLLLVVLWLPRIVAALRPVLRRTASATRWNVGEFSVPNRSAVLHAFIIYCANYLLIGLGFWLVAQAIPIDVGVDYLYLSAVFALSWLAGFLMPGSPAGLGVREGAMTILLASVVTGDAALVMVVSMRVATLLGDALCFAGSAIYLHIVRREGMHGPAA